MPYPNFYRSQNIAVVHSFYQVYLKGYEDGSVDTYKWLESKRLAPVLSAEDDFPLLGENHNRIGEIMERYELNNKDDVQLFLNENASSLALVNETYSKIYEFIPETRKVTLEVLVDPEDNKKNLIAKINLNLPVDEAFNKLDNFDKQWFASKFIDSEMMFNVSLDFEE